MRTPSKAGMRQAVGVRRYNLGLFGSYPSRPVRVMSRPCKPDGFAYTEDAVASRGRGKPQLAAGGGQPPLPYGDLKTEGPATYGSLFWSGPFFFLWS